MLEPAIAWNAAPHAPGAPKVPGFDGADGAVEALGPDSGAGRRSAEAFIEAAYRRAFNGRPSRHYPILLALRAADGRVLAAAGLRRAGQEPLFLEQYLDVPIEAAVSRQVGMDVGRTAILEIGGLAAVSPMATLRLFAAIADLAAGDGCEFAVATMTRQLRRKFDRLQIPLLSLGRASRERLGPAAADWGGYYDRDPQVVAGALGPAIARALGDCASSPEIAA